MQSGCKKYSIISVPPKERLQFNKCRKKLKSDYQMIVECNVCESIYKAGKPEDGQKCIYCGTSLEKTNYDSNQIQQSSRTKELIHNYKKTTSQLLGNILGIVSLLVFILLSICATHLTRKFASKQASSFWSFVTGENSKKNLLLTKEIRNGLKSHEVECVTNMSNDPEFTSYNLNMRVGFCKCYFDELLNAAEENIKNLSYRNNDEITNKIVSLLENKNKEEGPGIKTKCLKDDYFVENDTPIIERKPHLSETLSEKPLHASTAQVIFSKHAKNVAYIEGIHKNSGTGYFITSNIVLTNRHVVYGADKKRGLWNAPKLILTKDGRKITSYKKMICSKRIDVCAIYLGTDVHDYNIKTTSRDVSAGEDVYIIGHPSGMPVPIISSGIATSEISSFPLLDIDSKAGVFEGFTTDAAVSPGSSGSPVISKDGEYIGMAVASIRDSQNLNFIISAKEIQNFLTLDQNETVVLQPGFEIIMNIDVLAKEITSEEKNKNKSNKNSNVFSGLKRGPLLVGTNTKIINKPRKLKEQRFKNETTGEFIARVEEEFNKRRLKTKTY